MSPFKAVMHHAVSVWLFFTKQGKLRITTSNKSERDHVAALLRIWIKTSDWFGTSSSVGAGPVSTLITVGPAGTAVAAESHGVGEDRVGVHWTARQYGRAVFHLVIGTASLD